MASISIKMAPNRAISQSAYGIHQSNVQLGKYNDPNTTKTITTRVRLFYSTHARKPRVFKHQGRSALEVFVFWPKRKTWKICNRKNSPHRKKNFESLPLSENIVTRHGVSVRCFSDTLGKFARPAGFRYLKTYCFLTCVEENIICTSRWRHILSHVICRTRLRSRFATIALDKKCLHPSLGA